MHAYALRCALASLPAVLLPASKPASAAGLLDARVGETVEIEAFRHGPSQARLAAVTLERIDLYAAGAQVLAVRRNGVEAVPKSTLHALIGIRRDGQDSLYLLVDPVRGRFRGAVFGAGDPEPIEGRIEDGRRLLLAPSQPVPAEAEPFRCADSVMPEADVPGTEALAAALGASSATPVPHADAVAILAIDTDNELLALKFGDDTAAATDYLAGLVAGINVIYRRDLGLRLLQGTTFLRPGDVADPYTSTPADSTSVQLGELSHYWSGNPQLTAPDGSAVVPRTFVTLISGKSASNWSAAGVATVLSGVQTNYCLRTGASGHYNLTRVFKYPGATADRDVSIVAHEIGHNLGASHTHCSDRVTGAGGASTNTIDQCATASACYTGPVSCPVEPSYGTLMSYCSSPCTKQRVFHPAHQVFLSGRIATNIANGCLAIDDLIFRDAFDGP